MSNKPINPLKIPRGVTHRNIFSLHGSPVLPCAGRNVPPVEPPGDDGHRHPHSLAGEGHCGASGRLNGLFWGARHRGRGCEETRRAGVTTSLRGSVRDPSVWPGPGCEEERRCGVEAGLTAAVLIGLVGAVRLFVALIAGRDAGPVAQAFELLRGTVVARLAGGWTVRTVRTVSRTVSRTVRTVSRTPT